MTNSSNGSIVHINMSYNVSNFISQFYKHFRLNENFKPGFLTLKKLISDEFET